MVSLETGKHACFPKQKVVLFYMYVVNALQCLYSTNYCLHLYHMGIGVIETRVTLCCASRKVVLILLGMSINWKSLLKKIPNIFSRCLNYELKKKNNNKNEVSPHAVSLPLCKTAPIVTSPAFPAPARPYHRIALTTSQATFTLLLFAERGCQPAPSGCTRRLPARPTPQGPREGHRGPALAACAGMAAGEAGTWTGGTGQWSGLVPSLGRFLQVQGMAGLGLRRVWETGGAWVR